MRKGIIFAAVIFIAALAVSVAFAIDSSKCVGKPMSCGSKPAAAPVEYDTTFKRDVLGKKVPVESYHKDGGAGTDTATKYEETLITGREEK